MKASFMKKRTLTIGLITSLAFGVLANGSVASAAAKTTKPKKTTKTVSGTGERLKADYANLPVDILVRRAAKARGARTIAASVTFVDPEALPSEGKYLFKGTVDYTRRQGDVNFDIEGVTERYLFVDDTGYLKVEPDRIAELGGSWVRSAFTDSPKPSALILMDIAFGTPAFLDTVKTWKDKSTDADKAKKIRRLSGAGSVTALTTFDPDKFEPNVAVEALVQTDGTLTAVKWNLKPLPEATEVKPVKFLNTYGPRRPLVVTAPVDDVVDYSDAGTSSDSSGTSDTAV
jgi:hypothetical protein